MKRREADRREQREKVGTRGFMDKKRNFLGCQ